MKKTALQTEWTIAITAQAITESVGVAVTQGAVTGTLGMALQNEWTLAITSQDITENAGVTETPHNISLAAFQSITEAVTQHRHRLHLHCIYCYLKINHLLKI